ncbi:MAG TPA: hypothetical protein VLT36_14815, partial [Candidatus Dormibacteraeota bacterium]|nr:hypothetical protein [Candidatus Dormibacteraeota bacterium]
MTSIFSRGGFQILVVCLLVAGCRKAGQTVLGKDPSGERQLIAAIIAENTSRPIMIAGVIVEKCPVA